MSNKKRDLPKEVIMSYAIVFGIVGMFVVAMWALSSKAIHNNKYVITDKDKNKIIYRSLRNPYDTHVMTFDDDTVFRTGGWYPYLSIGDTIDGPAQIMNKPICRSLCYRGLMFQALSTTIESKNGKSLADWREIAKRDNAINEMKAKQR